eukprot:403359984
MLIEMQPDEERSFQPDWISNSNSNNTFHDNNNNGQSQSVNQNQGGNQGSNECQASTYTQNPQSLPSDARQSFIPQEMPPSVNLSDTLFREILLAMRCYLKSDQIFFQNIKVMQTVLKNIINDPTNQKFHRLKASNEKIKKAITECEQSRFILEMLGFERVQWKDTSQQGAIEEEYFMLNQERLDMREYNLGYWEQGPNNGSNNSFEERKTSKINVPVNSKVKEKVNKIKNHDSIMKNRLLQAHQERQRDAEAKLQTRKCRRVITTADLQKKIDEETRFKNNAQSAGKGDSERWGIRALELTNQFRAQHGLPALSWNQALHDIAQPHNVNMATGKVPVGAIFRQKLQ